MYTLLAVFENLTPMNKDVLKHAFRFLWQGLLAIFVVIALIVITVKLTQYVIERTEKAKKEKETQSQQSRDEERK